MRIANDPVGEPCLAPVREVSDGDGLGILGNAAGDVGAGLCMPQCLLSVDRKRGPPFLADPGCRNSGGVSARSAKVRDLCQGRTLRPARRSFGGCLGEGVTGDGSSSPKGSESPIAGRRRLPPFALCRCRDHPPVPHHRCRPHRRSPRSPVRPLAAVAVCAAAPAANRCRRAGPLLPSPISAFFSPAIRSAASSPLASRTASRMRALVTRPR